MIFVGHVRELAALHEELDRVTEGEPRVVLVEGDGGSWQVLVVVLGSSPSSTRVRCAPAATKARCSCHSA